MSTEYLVELISQLILFLIISYFIFYKFFLNSLGIQIAKLSSTQDFDQLIEDLIQLYWNKEWDYGWGQNRIIHRKLTYDYYEGYSKKLTSISKELGESIPPKIADIERLCRDLFNVDEEKK